MTYAQFISHLFHFPDIGNEHIPPSLEISLGKCLGNSRRLPPMTWRLADAVMRGVYRLRAEGLDAIPRLGPCVFVANHASHLDIFVLASQLRRARNAAVVPLAAADYFFRNPILASLSGGLLNALPVRRDAGHRHELAHLRHELLRNGSDWSCLMFPEGTRSRDGCLQPFRAGIGALVAGTEVPVVPCHISGTFEAWPAATHLPRMHGQVTVRFGEPQRFREMPNRRSGWDQVAEDLHARIEKLAA